MKANLNLTSNTTALTRVDHGTRMDRVETALDQRAVNLQELGPQQLAEHREFGARTLDAIGGVTGFLPNGPMGPGLINPTPQTPEQREKELEELIKEKTDPDFAAKKKAERTAKKLGSLFNSRPPMIFRGIDPGFGQGIGIGTKPAVDPGFSRGGGLISGGMFPSPDPGAHNHSVDKAIINLLFTLEGDELEMVKTEFEKTQGKTLEGAVRERFRGDVQQTLLKYVQGGKENEGGPKGPKKAAE